MRYFTVKFNSKLRPRDIKGLAEATGCELQDKWPYTMETTGKGEIAQINKLHKYGAVQSITLT